MKKEVNISPVIPASVFSWRIIFPVFYSLVSTLLLPLSWWYILTSGDVYDILAGSIVFVMSLVLWLVMVWGELRLRAVRICFKETCIEIVPFLGFGRKQQYQYDQVTGYTTLLQPSLPLPYECITLLGHQKELLQVSAFYFSNYKQLKTLMKEKFEDKGREEYSLKKAFTEIFTSGRR